MPDTRSRFAASSRLSNLLQGSGVIWKFCGACCLFGLLSAGDPSASPAQAPLPGTPLFGPSNMPLVYFERIPIAKILANPGDYHLRQIRITGLIRSLHTDVLTQGCGRAHELTTFTLEDETGTIDVFDQGACGGNTSRVRAATLAVGDLIDLFVQVVGNRNAEGARGSVELLVIWIERARN